MGELVEWSPLPRPARGSPFYALKSVAFSKGFAAEAGRLPPLARGRGAQLSEFQASAWATAAPHPDMLTTDAQLAREAEDFLQQPRARRDAAFAEHKKVEEQLRGAKARLQKEAVLRGAAELRTQETLEKAQSLGETLAEELTRVREQQRILRALRAAAREQKGLPSRHSAEGAAVTDLLGPSVASTGAAEVAVPGATEVSVPGTTPDSPAAQPPMPCDSGHKPTSVSPRQDAATPSLASSSEAPGGSKPGSPQATAGEAPAAASQPTVEELLAAYAAGSSGGAGGGAGGGAAAGTTLDTLLLEMQQVRAAFQVDVAKGSRRSPLSRGPPSPSGGRSSTAHAASIAGRASPRHGAADDDEEADIEVVRSPNGASLARMRHPSGAEAAVDLRTGEVVSWCTRDGRAADTAQAAAPRAVQLIRLSLMDGASGGDVSQRSRRAWRLVCLDDSNNEPSVTLACGGDGGQWPWHLRRTLTLTADALREHLAVENLASSGSPGVFEARVPGSPAESVSVPPAGCWAATCAWSG